MIFYLVLIIALALVGIKFLAPTNEEPFNGALSRGSTDAIKGIFILVVFGSHIFSYIIPQIPDLNYFDRLYISANGLIRQLLVVMFLFYSGYGVAESINFKGDAYVNAMPRKRILTTLLNFSVAVCFFIVLGLLIGNEISLKQGLLSLIGWETVGNSNWYIFCILVLYVATYLSFKIFKNRTNGFISSLALTGIYVAVVQHFRGGYWVDTAFAYPAGIAFSVYKDYFLKLFQKHYWCALFTSVIIFLLFYNLPQYKSFYIFENITAVVFALIVVLVTMRVRIENAPLKWLGKNLFPLYIYQRIPMIALLAIADGYFVAEHQYLYIVLSFIITIGIAYIYKYIAIKDHHLDKLFKRK